MDSVTNILILCPIVQTLLCHQDSNYKALDKCEIVIYGRSAAPLVFFLFIWQI